MAKQTLNPSTVHKPGNYSHATRKGNTLYIAGQVARNLQGELVGPGDVKAQTEQVYANIKAIVEAAGGTMDDIMKITVYATNAGFLADIGEVRNRYFNADSQPASTFVMISALAQPGFLVEIEAIAELG
jgi:reactive intermediate/imine deaminase